MKISFCTYNLKFLRKILTRSQSADLLSLFHQFHTLLIKKLLLIIQFLKTLLLEILKDILKKPHLLKKILLWISRVNTSTLATKHIWSRKSRWNQTTKISKKFASINRTHYTCLLIKSTDAKVNWSKASSPKIAKFIFSQLTMCM